jgi:ferritin-like metal-binding protein YciE
LNICDLSGLYRYGVQELHDAAAQTAVILPGISSSVESVGLRRLIERQALQAAKHRLQLEAVLARHGVLNHKTVDPAVTALLGKAASFAVEVGDADLRDAALLPVLRRIVHHGIVACTLVSGHARTLSLEIDRRTLVAVLEEDRAAERGLADLEHEVNQLALTVSVPAYL